MATGDPNDFEPFDFDMFRKKWPDHAISMIPPCAPYFWATCSLLGMENAMLAMAEAPSVYHALLRRLEAPSIAQREREFGTFARCAFGPNPAAVPLDDPVHGCEPDSLAGEFRSRVKPLERLE